MNFIYKEENVVLLFIDPYQGQSVLWVTVSTFYCLPIYVKGVLETLGDMSKLSMFMGIFLSRSGR